MAYGLETISSEAGRIDACFATARSEGRCVLVPYLTAGYPAPAATADLLDRLARAGADLIELGVPFSDPLADGPTIQRASQQAIGRGATLQWTLEALADFRTRHETPVVLFTYLNPILRHGVDRFIDDSVAAGADGVLITDLPVGCDPTIEGAFERSKLSLIRLIAPTTPESRIDAIAGRAQGFVYYISRTGVTGATTTLREGLGDEVGRLRERLDLPIAVGFGISSPTQAAEVAGVADGVVVGSALIGALDQGGPEGMEGFLAGLRAAIDAR